MIVPPLSDTVSIGWRTGLDAQVAGQVHAQAGGIRRGRLLTTNSKVIVPATSPLVIVNEVKLAKPGLVMPLLTPLTRMSVPRLSTAHPADHLDFGQVVTGQIEGGPVSVVAFGVAQGGSATTFCPDDGPIHFEVGPLTTQTPA